MSGNETTHSLLNHDVLAFEYVTGVMRGEERSIFERLLHTNDKLAEQVRFWEEQLMQLSNNEERALTTDVWQNIHAKLQRPSASATPPITEKTRTWSHWLWWSISSTTALVILSVLLLFKPGIQQGGPNADYVAVLTDSSGAPRLTVLTAQKGVALWLKWETMEIAPNKNLQLWAVSKRDGQIRPLGVFDKTSIEKLPLDTPNWRLIKDAESLLLTEEDIGGSPLDEPSSTIIAKGVCVLLAKIET